MELSEVIFPCDIPQWSSIKEKLLHIAAESHTLSSRLLICKLCAVHDLLPKQKAERGKQRRSKNVNIDNCFDGLDTFLENSYSDEEREIFFCRVVPYIIRKAVEIENLKPRDGLNVHAGQESRVSLSRNLIASVLACSFLCLWPYRRGYSHDSPLNAINFDGFYSLCKSRTNQCAKLKCILHYFETISVLYSAPKGSLIFHRQVLNQTPLLSDWLKCDTPLCHMTVFSSGAIEDAGQNVLQADFANSRIGGAVLTTGCVQEEIRFCTCPELISSMLFQGAMADNEAILIQGFENFSYYKGYSKSFRYAGPYHDPAEEDEHGNLQNYMCCFDALRFKGVLTADDQYRHDYVLRELTKAFIAFDQKCFKLKETFSNRQSPESEAVSAMTTVVEQYFATLSEDILTNALQDTLMSGHEDSSSSSQHSHSQAAQADSKRDHHIQSTHETGSFYSDTTRRRSSNFSEFSGGSRRPSSAVSSRRPSSDVSSSSRRPSSDVSRRGSDMSRRSSSSTTSSGSRRSSGATQQSSASTEVSSELEEYFATFQPRHIVKSKTIEEVSPELEMTHTRLQSEFPPVQFTSNVPDVRPLVRPKVQLENRKVTLRSSSKNNSKQDCDIREDNNSQNSQYSSKLEHSHTTKLHSSIDQSMPQQIPDLLTEQILASSFSQVQNQTDSKRSHIVDHVETPIQFQPTILEIKPESDSSIENESIAPIDRLEMPTQVKGRNHTRASTNRPNQLQVDSQPPRRNALSTHRRTNPALKRARKRSTPVSNDVLALVDDIVDEAFVGAIKVVQRDYLGMEEEEHKDDDKRTEVEGFVGGIMQNIWSHSQYNVKKHIRETEKEQQTWTSDSEIDLDLDLYVYADDFVSHVLDDAVETFKAQKREEQEKLEAMWRRAQERFELDAMYFDAEFNRFTEEETRPKIGSRFVQSVIEQDMMRRRSLDELGKYGHGSKRNGISHLRGYESNGRTSPLLLFSGGRRASEPIAGRRGSFESQYLHTQSRYLYPNQYSKYRRKSSGGSTTSREIILDWFNQNRQSVRRTQRYRTTSSHLDWFVQDLLLEAFNGAFKELFGEESILRCHEQMEIKSTQFFHPSSGSSASEDFCDISINIPESRAPGYVLPKPLLTQPRKPQQYSTNKSRPSKRPKKVRTCTEPSNQRATIAREENVSVSMWNYASSQTSFSTQDNGTGAVESAANTSRSTNEPNTQNQYSSIAAFASQMMQGLCDNLSNSVLEDSTRTIQGNIINRDNITPAQNTSGTRIQLELPDTSAQQSELSTNVSSPEVSPRVNKSTKRQAKKKSKIKEKKTYQCLPIATGNWGCGAYNGDPQLKAFIQWMAASRLRTENVYYYTFSHPALEDLGELCRQLEERETRVDQLAQLVVKYCNHRQESKRSKITLFEFIKKAEL